MKKSDINFGSPAQRYYAQLFDRASSLRHPGDLTKAAHEARRVKIIKEIIDCHARKLWGRKPSFKSNRRGTADQIRKSVMNEIGHLAKDAVPPEWQQPADESDPPAVAREVNRIRRHLPTA
jgi:hypothetical protein